MGLETVVRPVVFPNIRPPKPQVLTAPGDPTQGFATINGSGGRLILLPHSYSLNVTKQEPHRETKRQFDVDRVYQKDDAGNIKRSNFVDVERIKRILAKVPNDEAPPVKIRYADPPTRDNVETQETDVSRDNTGP